GDFDRNFRAIGLGEPGLVFQTRRDRTITGFMGIAVFVEFEQFGRKRLAAGVALALLLIDVDSQLSCHGKCFSQIISRDLLVRARVPVILARWFFGCLLAAPISYILLHSRPPRSSREKIVA